MEPDETWRPDVGDLYAAGVVGALLAMIFVVVAIAMIFAATFGPAAAAMALFTGGFTGLFLTIPLAFLVIAPLATGIGLVLARAFGPRRWLGAAVGGVTGSALSGGLMVAHGLDDPANPVMAALLIAASVAAGLIVQRRVLPPGRRKLRR
ncbi:hypothetical protein [Erythrobacter sp.]|uniref:hypothetical protein n=1 Tax=Erythrobacter sp. TaxID=1042 RepID=UPI001425E811|nr:hypothetical protein [Erythrobacter sp.]QIQ87256.1 MAG: hypothetical protein G9473_11600 [Erythrobacter sp.]